MAFPVAFAVTTPEAETVATLVSLLDHVTVCDGLLVPFTVAVKVPVFVPFKSRLNEEGETETELTVGEEPPEDVTVT